MKTQDWWRLAREMRNRPRTDPYEVLGVAEDVTTAQIKAAYRKLALRHHPDHGRGDGERFKEVAEAYSVLSDPDKREFFDTYGLDGERRRDENAGGFEERFYEGFRSSTPLLSDYEYIGTFGGIPHYHTEGILTCPLPSCPMRDAAGNVRRIVSKKNW